MRPQLVLCLLALTVLAGCSGSTTTSSNPPGDNKAVEIKNVNFNPTTVNLLKGSTLVWTNDDAFAHTVTANDGSFDSGAIASGKTFSHRFDASGTFAYKCTIHPNMMATVTVS